MKDVVELLKTHMVEDMNVLKFVAEQLFGKAMQPVGNPDGGPLLEGIEITFKK